MNILGISCFYHDSSACLVIDGKIIGAVQEGAAFLKLGVGARAVGMGGAYTAIADDVNSMGWNPAGI